VSLDNGANLAVYGVLGLACHKVVSEGSGTRVFHRMTGCEYRCSEKIKVVDLNPDNQIS